MRTLTHLFAGVPVSDLDASIDWYTRFFGRPPDLRVGDEVLWDIDTAGPQKAVNEVPARGGSLNGPGPAIAGGMLFLESGYAANGMPGNVLLVYSVDGK